MSTKIQSALYSCIASGILMAAALSGAVALPVHAAPAHHEVKTEPGRGGVPVVAVTINGKGPFKLVVDTGAPGPLRLDTKVADALGLKAIRYDDEGDGSGNNEFKVAVVPIADLRIGTFTKKGLEANVMDMKQRGFEMDGVFGMAAFADEILTLDYGRGTLSVDSGSLAPANGKDIFNYRVVDDGLIEIDLTIAGKTVPTIVDTGQTMVGLMLPEAIATSIAAGAPKAAGKGRTVSNAYTLYEVPVTQPIKAGTVTLPIDAVRYPALADMPNLGSKALRGGVLRLDQRNKRIQISFPS